jgi:hypothetical protein
MRYILDNIILSPCIVGFGICKLYKSLALVWQPEHISEDEKDDRDPTPGRHDMGAIADSGDGSECKVELIVDILHLVINT